MLRGGGISERSVRRPSASVCSADSRLCHEPDHLVPAGHVFLVRGGDYGLPGPVSNTGGFHALIPGPHHRSGGTVQWNPLQSGPDADEPVVYALLPAKVSVESPAGRGVFIYNSLQERVENCRTGIAVNILGQKISFRAPSYIWRNSILWDRDSLALPADGNPCKSGEVFFAFTQLASRSAIAAASRFPQKTGTIRVPRHPLTSVSRQRHSSFETFISTRHRTAVPAYCISARVFFASAIPWKSCFPSKALVSASFASVELPSW